jgi:hypothetical protein
VIAVDHFTFLSYNFFKEMRSPKEKKYFIPKAFIIGLFQVCLSSSGLSAALQNDHRRNEPEADKKSCRRIFFFPGGTDDACCLSKKFL